MHILSQTNALHPAPNPDRKAAYAPDLVETAEKFEAAILAELLRAAGAEQKAAQFGGGIGEDQFSSLLIDAQAQRIAAAGGIGLAELVLRSFLARDSLAAGGK